MDGDRTVISLVSVNAENGRQKTLGNVIIEPNDLGMPGTLTLIRKLHGKIYLVQHESEGGTKEIVVIYRESPKVGDKLDIRRLVCFDQDMYLACKV